jgi:hypothetical protein
MPFKKIEIRASGLQPRDILTHDKIRFEVVKVEKLRNQTPKKVMIVVNNHFSDDLQRIVPWDRRLIVERDIPEESEKETSLNEVVLQQLAEKTNTTSQEELPHPPPPSISKIELLPHSERVAYLIAEAREEFIAKVRRILRENP